jgi:hypothetical protein
MLIFERGHQRCVVEPKQDPAFKPEDSHPKLAAPTEAQVDRDAKNCPAVELAEPRKQVLDESLFTKTRQ